MKLKIKTAKSRPLTYAAGIRGWAIAAHVVPIIIAGFEGIVDSALPNIDEAIQFNRTQVLSPLNLSPHDRFSASAIENAQIFDISPSQQNPKGACGMGILDRDNLKVVIYFNRPTQFNCSAVDTAMRNGLTRALAER